MSINTGVAIHEGIPLTFEEHEGCALGTVILSQNRQLKQVFRGPCAEALRRAEQCSYELGLDGCYEIDGTDELRTRGLQGLQGMFPEVKRQIEARPKAAKWGFDQRWSPKEIARPCRTGSSESLAWSS